MNKITLCIFLASFAVFSETVRPPQYIYHWTTLESLNRLANDFKKAGRPTLKTITPLHKVTHTYPELANQPGTFGWTHPITGMALEGFEIYGNGEAVLRFEISPNPRILVLKTHPSSFERKMKEIDLSKYDLIFHEVEGFLREWIIVNPAIIKGATADPYVIGKEMFPEIEKWKRPEFRYPENELHSLSSFVFNHPKLRDRFVRPRVLSYLAHRKDIPESFLSPQISNDCNRVVKKIAELGRVTRPKPVPKSESPI